MGIHVCIGFFCPSRGGAGVYAWLSGHFWGSIPSTMFGGKISSIEVLIILAILWVVVWVVLRPLCRLVWAAIRKLEKD